MTGEVVETRTKSFIFAGGMRVCRDMRVRVEDSGEDRPKAE